MKISKVFALSVAILSAAAVMRASVPIVVATPGRMRAAMKLVTDAQALAVKGISPDSTKLFQQHLALFQQHKPIHL
jgi:hypothetical protein